MGEPTVELFSGAARVGPGNPLAVTGILAAAKVQTALALAVPTSAYTNVLDFTPAGAIRIVGYNCDFRGIVSARYRIRLLVGGVADANIVHAEEVHTDHNSWTPIELSVAAGQRIVVQAFHAEVTAQDIRATVNYLEG